MGLKLVLSLLLCTMVATTSEARRVFVKPGEGLKERLESANGGGAGGLVECWNALMELKSCSNEIVLFFLNGQTHIGSECCSAVDIITKNCWPAMLTSLGFTPEEGSILRGYCDASSSPYSPSPAVPPITN